MICPFCTPVPEDIILRNGSAYARFEYPVFPGHLLIIPRRHIPSVFEATSRGVDDLWDLVSRAKEYLDNQFSSDGYNIGINEGESAGQTIMHLNI